MKRHARIILITAGIALAGAVFGAVSGFVAIHAAVVVYLHSLAPLKMAAGASAIGAVFGALVAPALSWTLLRTAPLGLAVSGIAAGAGIGGAMGILAGASSVNPYVPFAFTRPLLPQGLLGALIGAAFVAVCLKLSNRKALGAHKDHKDHRWV